LTNIAKYPIIRIRAMMLENRFHVSVAEAPKGQELAMETFRLAIKALEECYPSLKENGKYSERLCVKLSILSSNDFRQKRISDISTQMTKAEENLIKSRVLKKPIRDERIIFEGDPMRWSTNPEDNMQMNEGSFMKMFSDSREERLNTALAFGQCFMLKAIQYLPIPEELQGEHKEKWKKNAINYLYTFTEELKNNKKSVIDLDKLERLRNNTQMFTLNSPEAKFVAYGAEVRILLPGQGIMRPAYSVGEILNDGIIKLLYEEAESKFFDLMKNRFIIPKIKVGQKNTYAKELAMESLRNLKIADKNTLFEVYVSSLIPLIMSTFMEQKHAPTLV
jgi:hypothetical protein